MLRYVSHDIVFQEVPNETTLALNISGCPNGCRGCHSPHLQKNVGEPLTCDVLAELLRTYGSAITCVCFMGGDAAPHEVQRMAAFVRSATNENLKVAWYSGRSTMPAGCLAHNFDYIKLGPYVEALGGLQSANSNQRFYKIEAGKMVDATSMFCKK